MKVALCLFFNYPFARNIPVLETIYDGVFDRIAHIQPLQTSDRANVHTVYRAAFNFGGFFSDSAAFLADLDADYVVFAGDDCVLNTALFGDHFARTFLDKHGEFAAFIPDPIPFATGREWHNPHRINTLARFARGQGLYDQRIEGWEGFLPDPAPIVAAAAAKGIAMNPLTRPDDARIAEFSRAQREVFNRTMGQKDSVPMPYPLIYAMSDFFIVSRAHLATFCHHVGLLAAMNVFSEVAVPTALFSLPGAVRTAADLGLNFDWTWGRNAAVEHFVPTTTDQVTEFIAGMSDRTLFRHPIKLSGIK